MKVFILATRVAGNDGVSLEAVRWEEVLTRMGHKVSFIAGQLDRKGVLLPDLHFQNSKIVRLHDSVVYGKNNYRDIEKEIFTIAGKIEGQLREIFNSNGKIDLLIVPNVLSLPVHFPLAVALARVIEEKNIKTIARHHDFWWERQRFLKSNLFPFFKKWFPPDLPSISHVVINSESQSELKRRTGLDAEIIWDCFDFNADKSIDSYSRNFRKDFGIAVEDFVFLQATRIVPRKRIELAIELVKKLNDPRVVYVVAGRAGDEAGDYEKYVRRLAKESGIRYKFIGNRINSHRKIIDGRRIYTLWDAFLNCDFVTYPTELEGFGNQFVEAVYFKKPVIITPYPVYEKDIRPLGFQSIEMTEKISGSVIQKVRDLMEDKAKRESLALHNFELGRKYFSYEWVQNKLEKLLK